MDETFLFTKNKTTMEKKNEDMSWNKILTQLGIGAAMGTAFLLFVCCSDAFFRFISGQ